MQTTQKRRGTRINFMGVNFPHKAINKTNTTDAVLRKGEMQM